MKNDSTFPIFNDMGWAYQYGLTKREYFAAIAMQGLLACPTLDATSRNFSIAAVKAADALILELEKK